jgi:arylsulfatase A-like enzyme
MRADLLRGPTAGRLWGLAVTSAVVFGVLEGLVLTFLRDYPALRAPYKVSPAALWVAPLVNLAVFASAGVCLRAVVRVRRITDDRVLLRLALATYLFLGVFAVLDAPGVLHRAAVGVLALGLAVAISRGVPLSMVARGATPAVSLVAALVVPALALGVIAAERTAEVREAGRLPDGDADPPNVLLIVLDTVRRDSVGGPSSLTPQLDRLARLGVTYTNAWSTSSWSLPTQASILTGHYPHVHGADWPRLKLHDRVVTLAEFLGARGYATGAFSSNSSWITPEYLGRGFLRFEVYGVEDLARRTTFGRVIARAIEPLGLHYSGRGKKASDLSSEFFAFLDDYPSRPFFAYLCYMDVNRTFHRASMGRPFWESAASSRDVRHAYDEGVRALDAHLAELLEELRTRALLDDTIVVVTSDHGESFGPTMGDRDPQGHGTSLYPEQTRVPLVVVFPDGAHAGATIDDVVSIRAVPATLVDALGADAGEFGPGLPLSERPTSDSSALLTLNYDDRQLRSVVTGTTQLIVDLASGRRELLDARTGAISKPEKATNQGHEDASSAQDQLQVLMGGEP